MTVKAYAEVVIDMQTQKLDRIFHYRIPSGMSEKLEVGMRVIVPFGPRTMDGYVVGFTDVPEVENLKNIIEIRNPDEFINKDLMSLALWLAEKYMCSKADALRCMMPAKVGKRTQWISKIENTDLFLDQLVFSLSPIERNIYHLLTEKGTLSLGALKKQYGAKAANLAINKLKELKIARISGEIKTTINKNYEKILGLGIYNEPLDAVIDKLSKKAPRQAQVLSLLKNSENLTLHDVTQKTGASQATVRDMIKKGLLFAREREVRRNPYEVKEDEIRSAPLQLNQEQAQALDAISSAISAQKHETFLLHGVTGSGKTEVYLQAIAKCLDMGRQAIVLVPEISLTPQTVERFKSRFGDQVAVLHSRLSDGERYDEWRMVKTGQVQIVIGARSAVFAPFANLGLVILDEEHETSYKQEDNPKYHAREAAITRAKITGAAVVLGSATPSVECYTRALAGRYRILNLTKRVMSRPLPEVKIVDLREEIGAGNRSIFSKELVGSIQEVIGRKEKVMLFLNRRGYSTFVVCRECGFVLRCPRCSISLTLHTGHNHMRCHYCDYMRDIPSRCPQCGSNTIRHFGIGTQRVEQEVKKAFPEATVVRMDMDTTGKKGDHEKILGAFKEGKIDILVGTQMIAKGLDFPDVTLVGVITADTALNLPDYRSAERTFQLLAQVAGRAGRGELPGKVIVQTYNPEHYSVITAAQHDYDAFYYQEMKVRELLGYPPYSSLIRILIHGTEENTVIRAAEEMGRKLSFHGGQYLLGVEDPVLGPAPAPISKIKNRYRWQLILRGKKAGSLREVYQKALKEFKKTEYPGDLVVSADVDPVSII